MSELKLQDCRLDDRYDILECLGRGSYAEIYKARDTSAGDPKHRFVVIKALNVFLQESPDADLERTLVENFQNEAVALDRVRHPNVISRIGHGTAIDLAETTFHYLVLEYLAGGDLASLCRRNPLPLDQALFYLKQVCAGLAHAHEQGVIHRDIKPQNLLLTADSQIVKIADFGVARIELAEGVITRVGTSVYAPPEHSPVAYSAQGETGDLFIQPTHLTPAADIYSLAKTTYTLLAGESPRQFAQRQITQLPDRITGQFWSDGVLSVLRRATERDPDKRFQTVREFWEDLSEASLPPTQPLSAGATDFQRPSITSLRVNLDGLGEGPPKPRFNSTRELARNLARGLADKRPRIVVPMFDSLRNERTLPTLAPRDNGSVPQKLSENELLSEPPSAGRSRVARLVVSALMILMFAGILLATHNYIRGRWSFNLPQLSAPAAPSPIGREGTTITDVNLRPDPSAANPATGLAERGSRVRVLNEKNNFYEVLVLKRGRPKEDPNSKDQGWLNKRYVQLD